MMWHLEYDRCFECSLRISIETHRSIFLSDSKVNEQNDHLRCVAEADFEGVLAGEVSGDADNAEHFATLVEIVVYHVSNLARKRKQVQRT
jgi:hypothetical protein